VTPTSRDLAVVAPIKAADRGERGATTARSRVLTVLVVVALAAALAGCGGDGDGGAKAGDSANAPTSAPAPFAACTDLTVPPAMPGAAGAGATGGQPLPAATLDCMAGGAPVATGQIKGPAVVNLWASWCGPCRAELPAFQQLDERAAGSLHVVGIDTRDDRDAAVDLADDLGLTFPSLDDPSQKVLNGLARQGLPVTVFVGADGKVRHVYNGTALDAASLTALVQQHLGVAVPVG
jgi:thiol-disulfide isomerase/thioredoxin